MDVSRLEQTVRDESEGWTPKGIPQRFYYLSQEVGEVAKELLNLSWAEDEASREEVREKLGNEIYDVVWNLCDLANMVGIDLEEAFERKAAINRKRWPKED